MTEFADIFRRIPVAVALGVALAAAAVSGAGKEPSALVNDAVAHIEAGDYALARVYLEPALIDPRLTPGERSTAYYLRGFAFLSDGLPVSAARDYHRALEFNPGNKAVQHALAHMFARGLGVTRDPEQAFSFYLKAARGDHATSKLAVGTAYLNGEGVDADVNKARFWFEDALAGGLDQANVLLGHSYRPQFTDEPDPDKARGYYEQAIEDGHVDAMVGLGYMYQSGELGGEPDSEAGARNFEAANRLFTQAAEKNSPIATALLGYAHLEGNGVAEDDDAAYRYLTRAAELGAVEAYRGLGYLFEAGRGVDEDADASMAWYLKAAEAGDRFAQLHLGFRLLTSGDATGAARWLEAAAQSGAAQGQNDYAWLLATHEDDAIRNGNLALHYATLAVAQKPSAQYVDTLAAAHAELGDFEQAVAEQQRAIALVPQGQDELLDELQRRLKVYEAARPWRE